MCTRNRQNQKFLITYPCSSYPSQNMWFLPTCTGQRPTTLPETLQHSHHQTLEINHAGPYEYIKTKSLVSKFVLFIQFSSLVKLKS